MKGIWPVLSAIFLLVVGIYQLPQLGLTVSLLSIGAIAFGIVPMTYYRLKYRSEFYTAPSEFFDEREPRVTAC